VSTDPRPDDQLLAASLSDPAAFDEVVRRHFRDLYRFAARQVGESDGDEMVAETFTLAFANRGRFNTEGSARAWLFGICVNVMRGHRRSAGRRQRAYQRAYEPELEDAPDDSVASAVDAQRRGSDLRAAIARLRPIECDVLLLYALAGLTGVEIATALSMPPSTVRSHLFRARSFLRSQLHDEPDPDPASLDLWRS
jgi:RNA polymerase sigma factor (sigma-70 family)